jgi:glycosyltransferase involved in cell wall biosynthesis
MGPASNFESPLIGKAKEEIIAASQSGIAVFMLHLASGGGKSGDIGGGTFHAAALAREWSAAGIPVYLIIGTGDQVRTIFPTSVKVVPVNLSGGTLDDEYLALALGSFRVSRRLVEEVCAVVRERALGERTPVLLALTSFPLDLTVAASVLRRTNLMGFVYLHHITPPPCWHPFRRGSALRTTLAWASSRYALVVAKLAGMTPFINAPLVAQLSGWNFKPRVCESFGIAPLPIHSNSTSQDRDLEACYISRLWANKGLLDIPPIWAKVCSEFKTARLVIAGTGQSSSLIGRLERDISRLGIDGNVQLLGRVTEEEKQKLLSRSKLFVFPSYEEGWSLAVMEAAIRGAVPVVYDLRAYDYLEDSAIRVPVANRTRFAEAIKVALRSKAPARDLGVTSKTLSERYSSSAVAARELNQIREVVIRNTRHR